VRARSGPNLPPVSLAYFVALAGPLGHSGRRGALCSRARARQSTPVNPDEERLSEFHDNR
jgi:hypothetical protein